MNRWSTKTAVASVLLFCSACGGKTWQTAEPVTPMTYGRVDAPIERSVGKLRRLALLPVTADVTLPLFKGAFSKERTRAAEEQLAQSWGGNSARFLEGSKGYDVVHVKDHGGDQAMLQSFAAWAMKTDGDQTAPPEMTRELAALAHRLSVDGFLMVRGVHRAPNVTTALTILTASLSWPLVALESRAELRGVIVDAATGRIVWKANVWQASAIVGEPLPALTPDALFRGIEHAVPKVLTE